MMQFIMVIFKETYFKTILLWAEKTPENTDDSSGCH